MEEMEMERGKGGIGEKGERLGNQKKINEW
jgi:hypothetical protein